MIVNRDLESTHVDYNTHAYLQKRLKNALFYIAAFCETRDLNKKLAVAFGGLVDAEIFISLVKKMCGGSNLPHFRIVPMATLKGAYGAFARSNATIYISREFLHANRSFGVAVEKVLLEEIGHYIDATLNARETPGDEGEIFAYLVLGRPLSARTLAALKTENDHATITVDGQTLGV
jgi:hypothetical protein